MQLTWLEALLSVCRLSSEEAVPAWATQAGSFFGAVRTPGELSLVCESRLVPDGVRQEGPFRAFAVTGPLPFSLVGVLSSLLVPISKAGISVFVMSTFDTDYVLVPAEAQDQTTLALVAAGHEVG